MDLTTDKFRSLVKKWQTMIEAHVDVKTTDGYHLRMFSVGFTKKSLGQVKKTNYAQSSQIRQIRKKMMDIMTREATTCDLKDLVVKFIPETIGKQIETECQGIYPLRDVYVRKVKLIKGPKFDPFKLLELHGESPISTAAVEAADRTAYLKAAGNCYIVASEVAKSTVGLRAARLDRRFLGCMSRGLIVRSFAAAAGSRR